MAGCLAALADPVRLALVGILAGGQRCVCELQEQVAIAPQSSLLPFAGVARGQVGERHTPGTVVDYRLDGAGFAALWASLAGAGVSLPRGTRSAPSRPADPVTNRERAGEQHRHAHPA